MTAPINETNGFSNAYPRFIIDEEKEIESLGSELKENVDDDEPGLAFKRSINNKVNQIKKNLSKMYKGNCYPHELGEVAKKGRLELHDLHVDFCNGTNASREKKEKFYDDILKTQEKIHSATFERENFTPPESSTTHISFSQFVGTSFSTPKSSCLKFPSNSYQDEMVTEVKSTIGSVRWIGAGLDLVGQAIVGTAKAICKAPLSNDLTGFESAHLSPDSNLPKLTGEKFCRSILHGASATGKAVLNATNLKEPVKHAIEYWKSLDGSSISRSLLAHGIPEKEAAELGKQYVSDLKTISLYALPGSTLKAPLRVIRTINRASIVMGEKLASISELFYLNSLNKSTFSLLHPIPSLSFNKSTTLHRFIKDEAGTLRFTREPKKLLTEAEVLGSRRLDIESDRAFDIAALKRKNAEILKALKERETAFKVAEVLSKEKQPSELKGLGSLIARQQKAFKVSKLDKSLLQNFQPLVLPKTFPKNMDEFMINAISLKNITYKKIGEDIIFFICSTRKYKYVSIENSILKASAIAGRKNAQRIFLTWDPITHSVASVVDNSKSILGVGEMARGEFNPFVLVEIAKKTS